jgi:Response regulators consisting of a CheY-like receiver domain and a winged-helix DNA-binding domain
VRGQAAAGIGVASSGREHALSRGSVAIATANPELVRFTSALFVNSSVTVAVWSPESREVYKGGADCDVVILDADSLVDLLATIRHLRRGGGASQIVCVNVQNAARMRALLDLGADDAVLACSPELECRLHAAVRRATTRNVSMRKSAGDVTIESRYHVLRCDGEVIALSPREGALLAALLAHPSDVVSTEALHGAVWGGRMDRAARARVRIYIGYLRRKLARAGSLHIRTVRGIGYRLEVARTPAVASSALTTHEQT